MVTLVTVATHSDGYFPYLKKSCERFSNELVVLGWGLKWTGFRMKTNIIYEYLLSCNENDIVCVIDSFDIVMLRSLEELAETFRIYSSLHGHKIILGCDKSPSWIIRQVTHMHFGTCHDIYLNAGSYIGVVKELKSFIRHIRDHPNDDDQMAMIEYVQKHPHKIHIDSCSLFFLTINYPVGNFLCDERIKITNQVLFYRGLKPFFAHGNGNTDMCSLIKQLGYTITSKEEEQIRSKALQQQIIKTISYFYPVIILFIIAIILFCYVYVL
jgi:hypothetical protein